MEAHGAVVVNDPKERLLLDGHFYYSGEIPRVSSFETGRTDHLCRPNSQAPWQPDPFLMDERFVVAHVRGQGLIVFSACSMRASSMSALMSASSSPVFPFMPSWAGCIWAA